jgi:predicted amidophosphoribosyltransferase
VTEITRLLVDQIEPEELADFIFEKLSINSGQISQGLTLVPIPSSYQSYRQRGFSPANEVCRALLPALKPVGARVVKLLKRSRSVADQSTLATGERWQNQRFSMRARHDFSGPVILIDDIVTTGATLIEAKRAAEQAGATVLGFCTIAETLRKRDANNQKSDT